MSSLLTKMWHHLFPTFARGKDLSNDAQIRVISLMESEKLLKKLSEKLRAKFPGISPVCSMVKIACLDDSCDASAKKSKVSCCKGIFDQTKANLAEIQP